MVMKNFYVYREQFPLILGFATLSDPDFMFADIQLGKGKARNQREVKLKC